VKIIEKVVAPKGVTGEEVSVWSIEKSAAFVPGIICIHLKKNEICKFI
jgi:hypothetical protein